MTRETFAAWICAEAHSWVGTPYQKLGCVKGVGGDCTAMFWALYTQHYPAPWPRYAQVPAPYQALTHLYWDWERPEELLLQVLRRHFPALTERSCLEAAPGDFLVLGAPGHPAGHMAILVREVEDQVIHCLPRPGQRRATITLERRHAAFRKLERTAFRLATPGAHAGGEA